LAIWPRARERFWKLLCDLELEPGARWQLLKTLFWEDRSAGRRWALAALQHPENGPLLALLAAEIARQPEEADVELLGAILSCCLRATPPAGMAVALDSPSLRVRLQARAALAAAGDETSQQALLAWAERGEHPVVRAEAARALGQSRSFAVEARLVALLQPIDQIPRASPDWRAQIGLAAALGRLGTVRSRTALLRGGWFWAVRASLVPEEHNEMPPEVDDSTWAKVEPGWD
jgi:hypothetical protein